MPDRPARHPARTGEPDAGPQGRHKEGWIETIAAEAIYYAMGEAKFNTNSEQECSCGDRKTAYVQLTLTGKEQAMQNFRIVSDGYARDAALKRRNASMREMLGMKPATSRAATNPQEPKADELPEAIGDAPRGSPT